MRFRLYIFCVSSVTILPTKPYLPRFPRVLSQSEVLAILDVEKTRPRNCHGTCLPLEGKPLAVEAVRLEILPIRFLRGHGYEGAEETVAVRHRAGAV